MDLSLAYRGTSLVRKIAYHFFDKRPLAMDFFNQKVLQWCHDVRPDFLLTTGCSPLNAETLKRIGNMKIKRLNYLTDDPWNPVHRSQWFFKALPNYDAIFTVRHANIDNLKSLGCLKVTYLPFGYDPNLFYLEQPTEEQRLKYESEILFVGGADKDRLPYLEALIQAGYKVRLYGGYWDRFKTTHNYSFGIGDAESIRLATACAQIALCLVRRANRDDNCMRSFEIPASGGCMLAEDVSGHRAIFGSEKKAVLYFKTRKELLEKTEFLLKNNEERNRLADVAHRLITTGNHTYKDRLMTMLKECVMHV